ncbi:MAG: twin-arginine translocase TatA/TatE family subunit [bacterium]|nr:twin-arginine translocase TatA/TatE family subunit [bacterium]MDT8365585.1 twin-arginine translocase TatA/TatE family subunit [bacterium]
MIGGLGMQELLVILAIVMLLFGGKKLPELGKGLGKAIRGFKQAEEETVKELKRAAEGDPSTSSGQEDEAKGDGVTEREKTTEDEAEKEEADKGKDNPAT